MLIDIDEKTKIVYYYLSQDEAHNETLRELLKPKYREWKERGYIVCVFLSGSGDIKVMLEGLLRHNQWVLVKKTLKAQREKFTYDRSEYGYL